MEAARTSHADALEDDVATRIAKAQDAERARLAQEVHDGPAQALSNAIFQTDHIERALATDPAAAAAEVRQLRDLLRRALDDVRDVIHQLRPPALDDEGLERAMLEAATRLRTLTGLTVTTDLTAPTALLAEDERTVVLRVTQEALQNVRKHADATMVVVSTGVTGEDWTLEIRDDGRGIGSTPPTARGRRTFGLQFMRERAQLIGARFDVRSRPDGGTVVRLVIPTGTRAGAKENG
jgi:signal transduction histidine kinase